MRRLINEYSACSDLKYMKVVDEEMGKIVMYAKMHDIDLHDALGVALMSLTAQFAEEFIRTGINLRRQERAGIKRSKCEYCQRVTTDELTAPIRLRDMRGKWTARSYRVCPACRKYLKGHFKYVASTGRKK